MYLNKFVVAVKVNGKILRENQNTVLIPFGSQYSVLLKNLDSRRAIAKLSIDGSSVDQDRSGFIIPANGSMEIERYIRNGNMESGNRFKFIERSAAVEAHRGIKVDDGIVRVDFKYEIQSVANRHVFTEGITVKDLAETLNVRAKDVIAYLLRRGIFATVNQVLDVKLASEVAVYFENEKTFVPWLPYIPPYIPPRPCPFPYSRRTCMSSIPLRSMGAQARGGGRPRVSAAVRRASMPSRFNLHNDAGITVPGSRSDQQFVSVSGFPTESHSEVIVIHLRGMVGDKAVDKSVTVSYKPQCQTCGKNNKSNSSFCSKCGTVLNLI